MCCCVCCSAQFITVCSGVVMACSHLHILPCKTICYGNVTFPQPAVCRCNACTMCLSCAMCMIELVTIRVTLMCCTLHKRFPSLYKCNPLRGSPSVVQQPARRFAQCFFKRLGLDILLRRHVQQNCGVRCTALLQRYLKNLRTGKPSGFDDDLRASHRSDSVIRISKCHLEHAACSGGGCSKHEQGCGLVADMV